MHFPPLHRIRPNFKPKPKTTRPDPANTLTKSCARLLTSTYKKKTKKLAAGCPESYDRRDKPSVLVTSPGSPDRVGGGEHGAATSGGAGYASRLTSGGHEASVGGRIQIKLGFEPGTLQLILTVICASGLKYRENGATRNPYIKVNIVASESPLPLARHMCARDEHTCHVMLQKRLN